MLAAPASTSPASTQRHTRQFGSQAGRSSGSGSGSWAWTYATNGTCSKQDSQPVGPKRSVRIWPGSKPASSTSATAASTNPFVPQTKAMPS
jgi:hypothetical protein